MSEEQVLNIFNEFRSEAWIMTYVTFQFPNRYFSRPIFDNKT